MTNFLDDVLDKVGEEFKGGKGFEAGTHKVIIGEAEAIKDSKDRDIIKVTVFNPDDNDQTAEATLWFHTEGGAKMSVVKVLGLLVHSVGDEKKEAVRDLGKKVFASADTPAKAKTVVLKLLSDKLIGKEGFLIATPSGNYTTTKYGDLWHYPAEAKTTAKDDLLAGAEPVEDTSEIPEFGDL